MIEIAPLVVAALGLPSLISAFRAFDRLVMVQRARYHDLWEREGRPHPYFHRSADFPRTIASAFATQRCVLQWTLQPPAWATSDSDASVHLRQLRRMAGVWNLIVMPLYVIALVMAAQSK